MKNAQQEVMAPGRSLLASPLESFVSLQQQQQHCHQSSLLVLSRVLNRSFNSTVYLFTCAKSDQSKEASTSLVDHSEHDRPLHSDCEEAIKLSNDVEEERGGSVPLPVREDDDRKKVDETRGEIGPAVAAVQFTSNAWKKVIETRGEVREDTGRFTSNAWKKVIETRGEVREDTGRFTSNATGVIRRGTVVVISPSGEEVLGEIGRGKKRKRNASFGMMPGRSRSRSRSKSGSPIEPCLLPIELPMMTQAEWFQVASGEKGAAEDVKPPWAGIQDKADPPLTQRTYRENDGFTSGLWLPEAEHSRLTLSKHISSFNSLRNLSFNSIHNIASHHSLRALAQTTRPSVDISHSLRTVPPQAVCNDSLRTTDGVGSDYDEPAEDIQVEYLKDVEEDEVLYGELQGGQIKVKKLCIDEKDLQLDWPGEEQSVVVKRIIKQEFAPLQLARSISEVKILQDIQHDNIIRLLDVFDTYEEMFMVFEFASYGDLHRLSDLQSFSEANTRRILQQVLLALEFIHRLRLVHGDIKPQNCLLFPAQPVALPMPQRSLRSQSSGSGLREAFAKITEGPAGRAVEDVIIDRSPLDGGGDSVRALGSSSNRSLIWTRLGLHESGEENSMRFDSEDCIENHEKESAAVDWETVKVKVGDFGLAQYVDDSGMIPFQGVLGTQNYIAPEILLRKDYTAKVDVWAVGIIAFQLLGGYEPFYPASACRTDPLEFEDRYWNEISFEAKDFISKCLDRDVSKRLSSIDALHHPWFDMKD